MYIYQKQRPLAKSTQGKKKEPREVGPTDKTMWTKREGTTVQMCGDSRIAETSISGYFYMGMKCGNKNLKNPENEAFVLDIRSGVLGAKKWRIHEAHLQGAQPRG